VKTKTRSLTVGSEPTTKIISGQRAGAVGEGKRRAKGTGSVYQRGGSWVGEITLAGKRHVISTTSEAETGARLDEMRVKSARWTIKAEFDRTRQPDFEEFAADALAEMSRDDGIRLSTTRRYRTSLEQHAYPVIGDLRLTDINAGHIREMLRNVRNKGLSTSSLHNARTAVSAVLTKAVEAEHVVTNVARGVPLSTRRGQSRSRQLPVSDNLVADCLDVMVGSYYYDPLQLIAYTGIRGGEALALSWASVDLSTRRIWIRHTLTRNDYGTSVGSVKTQAGQRYLTMNDSVFDLIARMWEDQGRPSDGLLFAGRREGRPMSPTSMAGDFKRRQIAAGLEPLRPHDLRHIALSTALARGGGNVLANLAAVAGHSRISTTLDLYGHALQGDAGIMDSLNDPRRSTGG
jgi:integrase